MNSREQHRTDLDPFDPAFIACPFPTYHELQAAGGAAYVDRGKGFWLITGHDPVREVASDPARFSSQSGSLGATSLSAELRARLRAMAPNGRPGDTPTLLTLDPPGHTRNRRLVSRAFTPRSVNRYEPMAREVCRELIGRWRDGQTVDFVSDFAIPLPVRVIAHALDVTDDRVDDFKRWSDASVAAIGADLTDEEVVEDYAELLELAEFVAEQIDRQRRSGPSPDISSQLVHAELDDQEASELGGEPRRRLTDDEIQSIVRQLLVAGNETTTNLLTQMIVELAAEPAWWRRMREEPTMIPVVVEEALRMASPSAANQRVATCEAEVGSVTIPEGDVVLVGYLAADHDSQVFADPERFDPSRPNLGEHMAFGRGIHFCPGAALARMEARVALEELTAAIETYEVGDADQLRWNTTFQLRAIRSLPFTPQLRPR